MDESIRISIQLHGEILPLDSPTRDGIVIGAESSASPRGLAISLRPGNAMTEFRLRRVRTLHDWAPGAFSFRVSLEGGALVCHGVDLPLLQGHLVEMSRSWFASGQVVP